VKSPFLEIPVNAAAMLDAETRLRALACAGLLIFALDLLVSLGPLRLPTVAGNWGDGD
jgi:hypothetical protein